VVKTTFEMLQHQFSGRTEAVPANTYGLVLQTIKPPNFDYLNKILVKVTDGLVIKFYVAESKDDRQKARSQGITDTIFIVNDNTPFDRSCARFEEFVHNVIHRFCHGRKKPAGSKRESGRYRQFIPRASCPR